MSIEIKEIRVVVGTEEEVKNFSKDTPEGVLADVVLYVSQALETAYKGKIPDIEEMQMHRLVMIAVSNIIISMISPRIASDDKNERMVVMHRYLDELKDITMKLYEESEKHDLKRDSVH